MYSLLTLAGGSFLLALLLTPWVRDLALRYGWLDAPDARRKLHRVAIPRLGGAAVLAAYIGAYAMVLALGLRGGMLVDLNLVWKLAPGVAVIFAVGLFDDLRGLTPWQKLGGQLLAAGVAFASGVQVPAIAGWPLPAWAVLPATICWLVFVTNAVNLIDGMDGLASGLALFASLTILVAALQNQNMGLAMAVVPLCGALAGFLRYNFNPATIFLGDSGSLTIGFLLGCYGLFWSQKSVTLLGVTAPMLALAIPLVDSGLSIVRRFLRRQPIFGADRGHVHHRLLDRGLSVKQAALLLYGAALLYAVLSLASSVVRDSYAGVVLILFGAVTWIGVQSLGYAEINVAGQLLAGGGFRRMLLGELVLRNFEESLRRAESSAEIWRVVRTGASELGFERVSLTLGDATFHHGPEVGVANSYWTVDVPLDHGGLVRLTRPFDTNSHQSVMEPFVKILRNELKNKGKHLEFPAEPPRQTA